MFRRLHGLLALLVLLAAGPVQAQPPAPVEGDVEPVIVIARQIGAPVWKISRGGSTLIIVADVDVPPGVVWRPEKLEAAIKGSRALLVPTIRLEGDKASRKALGAAQAEAAAPRLTPQMAARLQRLGVRDADKRSLRETAATLIVRALGRAWREDGKAVAVRAARRHRVRQREFHGLPVAWLSEPPAQARARAEACLEAAVQLAEQADADIRARQEAWRRGDVPALAASKVERARLACSLSDAPQFPKMQGLVEAALRKALEDPGVTVAVMPFWSLAQPNGLLDQLSEDLIVEGPAWRAEAG